MTDQETIWYLADEGHQLNGPYSAVEILQRVWRVEVSKTTLCWRQGMENWRPLKETEPFQSAFRAADENDQRPIWYLSRTYGQPDGPLSALEVFSRLRKGEVLESTLCWREGMQDWQPLNQTQPFQSALAALTKAADLVHFTCHCGNPIAMARQFAGRQATCAKCGAKVTVPDDRHTSSNTVGTSPSKAPLRRGHLPPPISATERSTKHVLLGVIFLILLAATGAVLVDYKWPYGLRIETKRLWARVVAKVTQAGPSAPQSRANGLSDKLAKRPNRITRSEDLQQALLTVSPKGLLWVALCRKDVNLQLWKALDDWIRKGGVLWTDTDLATAFEFNDLMRINTISSDGEMVCAMCQLEQGWVILRPKETLDNSLSGTSFEARLLEFSQKPVVSHPVLNSPPLQRLQGAPQRQIPGR